MLGGYFAGQTGEQRGNDGCGVAFFSESCSGDEFLCDGGRCLLPASVCDSHPDCHDRTDESNCSQKHKGAKTHTGRFHRAPHKSHTGLFHRVWWAENRAFRLPVQSKPPGELPSPAGGFWGVGEGVSPAPKSRTSLHSAGCLRPQLCIWQLSVEEGHVIALSFRNFSLETQDVCQFDYVEVHDGLSTATGRVLGR